MDADDVRRVRDDTLCVVHSQKQLELFCMKCQSLICMDCKLSEHLHHESHTLDEMADLAANQLSDDKTWLETVIADLQRNLEDRRNDQREFKDKKARVEREILHSHSTLVAAADKYRDDALANLKAASADTERMQAQNVDVLQAKLHGLRRLQRRIVDAEEAREGCRIITVAKEIKLGHGSQDLTKKFVTLPHLSKVSRPVHRSLMPEADLLFDSMKNFIGGARTVELKVTEPEVTIVERFQCEKDDDAVVFCVCPVENGAVWVSFEARSRHRKLPCKCFSEDGEMIRTLKSLRSGSEPVGRISIKERRGQGKIMFCTEEDYPPSMYAKMLSKDLYKVEHFKGKTYIGITHVLSEQPELCTCQTDQFSICCGPHRAFDANGKGNLFAVVTEPQGSDVSRDGRSVVSRLLRRDVTHDVRHDPSGDVKSDVKLYRRQRYKALDTYASPLTPFQPADVCFFTLRGLEVSGDIFALLIVSPFCRLQRACFTAFILDLFVYLLACSFAPVLD